MDANYMLACGIVSRKTGDPVALLEDAITAGVLTPDIAAPCMVELLLSAEPRPNIALTSEA